MRFPPLHPSAGRRTRGVALIIVLSFVVLLTGLILAFFSRSLSERQISNSSAGQVKTDLFTQGAIATIVDDLKQEIAAGSNATYYVDATGNPLGSVYVPAYPVTAVPALALKGTNPTNVTSYAANLLKRSVYDQNFFPANGDTNADKYSNGNTTATVALPAAAPTPSPAPLRLPSNRAANLSTTVAAPNGRSVSLTRWNRPLLMPREPNPTDPKQVDNPASTAFAAPDWILVARDGSNPGSKTLSTLTFDPAQPKSLTNPSASNSGYVTGRFAYTIYDEGGLLDANVAGYPTTAQPLPSGAFPSGGTTALPPTPIAKASLAYADLTVTVPKDATSVGGDTQPLLTAAQVNSLVSWRNYASAKYTAGAFAACTPETTPAGSPRRTKFDDAIFHNTNGFLGIGGDPTYYGLSTDKQSDRKFGTRQELINFFTRALPSGPGDKATITALQNSLQYFSTFSRGLNQPSYAPVSRVATATNQNFRPLIQPSEPKGNQPGGGNNVGDNYTAAEQDYFSPSLLNVRVQTSFIRNDGATTASVGEPLLKSRFPLNRLAWINYLGPSASKADSNLDKLVSDYGFDAAFLGKGDAATIKRYFGLTWDATNRYWRYDSHNGDNSGSGAIMKLQEIAASTSTPREPDFFEILKASVDMGALGKTSTKAKQSQPGEPAGGGHVQPLNFRFYQDTSVDAAIIQLAANMIDQFDLDGYPTRIVFDDGSGRREFRGVENLPYIYRLRTGSLKVRDSDPVSERPPNGASAALDPYLHSGTQVGYTTKPLRDTGAGIIMTVPDIWNPHDQNSAPGFPSPGQLRLVANSANPEIIAATNMGTTGSGLTTYSTFRSGGFVKTDAGHGTYRGNSYNDAILPNATAVPPIPYFTRGANLTGTLNNPALIMSGSNGGFNYPHQISPGTTNYLTFKVPTTNVLYHEPTMLGQADPTGASGLSMVVASTYLDIINLQGAGGVRAYSTTAPIYGIKGINGNPLGSPSGGGTQGNIGLVLGTYPLRWVGPRWPNSTLGTLWNYSDQSLTDDGQPISAITYSLQYQDPAGGGNWITYDEKYVDSDVSFVSSFDGELNQPGGGNYSFVDPRTPRFGSPSENNISTTPYFRGPLTNSSGPAIYWANTWLDTSTKLLSTVTEKPDDRSGFGSNFRGSSYSDWGSYAALGLHIQAINTVGGVNAIFWQTGLLAQNDPYYKSDGFRFTTDPAPGVGARDPNFWTGADGVARRAMGAYVAQNTIIGQPLATATGFTSGTGTPKAALSPSLPAPSQSRPIFLNRPFRSVGELGCVYSGNPWMNIDFSTPESAYSELLDVFCINENSPPDGLVAGVVNLNTRQSAVLKAVLTGAYVDDQNTQNAAVYPVRGSIPLKPLVAADADQIATLLTTRTSKASPSGNGVQPLQNVGDLVGRWNKRTAINYQYSTPLDGVHNIDGKQSFEGLSADLTLPTNSEWPGFGNGGISKDFMKIPRLREASVRALSTVGNARVWNVMIDVIAQNGRFPNGASTLRNFVVEGEQRYWVHLAIDRYSGAILDTKLEVVKE